MGFYCGEMIIIKTEASADGCWGNIVGDQIENNERWDLMKAIWGRLLKVGHKLNIFAINIFHLIDFFCLILPIPFKMIIGCRAILIQ